MKTKNLNGYLNIVGSNIKKYREQKGLSQRQLADKTALLGVNLYHSDILVHITSPYLSIKF